MTVATRRKNQTFTGKRKHHDPVASIPILWPKDPKAKRERLELFDAWRNVAAQILDEAKEDFRLLSAVRAVFIFHSGEIIASNRQIAFEAGHCSDKTITRYVQRYADLGLFIVSFGNRFEGPQMVRTRTIRLALPAVLSDSIELPENAAFDMDTSGPVGWDTSGPIPYGHQWSRSGNEQRDTSGPVGWDTSGPISRDTRKGGREKVSANGTAEFHSEPEAR